MLPRPHSVRLVCAATAIGSWVSYGTSAFCATPAAAAAATAGNSSRTVLPRMRADAEDIFRAGVAAALPQAAIQRHVRWEKPNNGNVDSEKLLVVGDRKLNVGDFTSVHILGGGKAAVQMAAALQEVLQPRVSLSNSVVVTKYGHSDHGDRVGAVKVLEAGHPVPDKASVRGAKSLLAVGDSTTKSRRLVFFVLSGGASALLCAPSEGLTLTDLADTTSQLLACGATIDEVNTVRKHLSAIAGGQLTAALAPATIVTLVLSDVVGDPLHVIGSGPTVPDPSTFSDAWNVLTKYGIETKVPVAVATHLHDGMAGRVPETAKEYQGVFSASSAHIVGNNRQALEAAADKARSLGYTPLVLTSSLQGEAREVAKVLSAIGMEAAKFGQPVRPPVAILCGGETTVNIRGTGKGGRNQELALAAALELQGTSNIVLLSAGTDGTDGPTDAAGAMADGSTVSVAGGRQVTQAALANNDAYTFFNTLGSGLIKTGPTGTNVMDLVVVLVH